MAILIKNMDKPKNCYNYPFNNSDCWCSITKSEIDRDDYTTDTECPIIEIMDLNFDILLNL